MPVASRAAIVAAGAIGVLSMTTVKGDEAGAQQATVQACCAVLELRQYTMKAGQREAFVALFDREFVESQEAVGMSIPGQFRDRQRADRFVWVRGYADMQRRHAALGQFYGGPVWKAHSAAANSAMIDSDDVRLLKPARPDTALRLDASRRPAVGETRPGVVVLAGLHYLRHVPDTGILARFEDQVAPELRRRGVEVEAIFVTESAPNTFKGLPVREGQQLLVWFATLNGGTVPPLSQLREASKELLIAALSEAPLEVLELDPTPRSLFGHHLAAQ